MAKAASKGRGRPKGARNKLTNEAKEAILMAFDKLGGVERLVKWIEKDEANETIFWTKIFPKLLPRPAAEPVPPPEPPKMFKGAFTWKTPEWAKKVHKEQLRTGVASIADLIERPPDINPGKGLPDFGDDI